MLDPSPLLALITGIISATTGIISATIDSISFWRDNPKNTSPSNENSHSALAIEESENKTHTERYRVLLGKWHRQLREDILQLNRRELANFYGFEKASYLEDCEAGLDEFPASSIKKLEQFFSVNPRYFQEGKEPIFQPFDTVSNRKDCRNLLEQGFSPYFLCSPDFDQDGHTFLVFWKEDNNYGRARQSNQPGSFYSSGGGRNNIYNMIYAMLDLGFKPSDVLFLNVRREEWDRLGRGSWYSKNTPGYVGAANHRAQDIFEDWYNSAQMLDRMANDPEIQAEIRAINAEFAVAEQDGLQDV